MLRPEQIELRVLHRLDRARAGEHVEDSAIELKDEWPDAQKAARRLAAHANAARLEPIIWVIGAKEDGTLTGASKDDLAATWEAIVSRFEGQFAPEMYRSDLISYEGTTVLAVTWLTERPPYVVREGDKNEVPWREGTRARSAKRHELLRMLVPTSELPECNPFHLFITRGEHGSWFIRLGVEVVPPSAGAALLTRGARLRVAIDGVDLAVWKGSFVGVYRHQFTSDTENVGSEWTTGGVNVHSPTLLDFTQSFMPGGDLRAVSRATAEATVRVARSERPLVVRGDFEYTGPRGAGDGNALGMQPVGEGD